MSRKKTYRYLRKKLEKFYRYVYPPIEVGTAKVDVELDRNTATVHVGDESFYIKSFWDGELEHEVYDFALYGALAVALTKNLSLHCDLPISRSCAKSIDNIYHIMRILNHALIYVQPIHLSNIVEDPVPKKTKPRVMCMSGGVDSTFGGLLMSKEKKYPYGILIAGADYPNADAPGFLELKDRVDRICTTFDMSLLTVETSIRSLKINWNMTHTLCLTMAMQFHASIFGKGAIAADFTPLEEITVGPWGNCAPIVEALNTTHFPIEYVGGASTRSEKIGVIWRTNPALLKEVSVCFVNKEIGGNCGECRKCRTTMVSMYAAGAECNEYFLTDKDLLTLLKNPDPMPDSHSVKRVYLNWYIDDAKRLPEGEVKDAVNKYIQEIISITMPLGDN